MATRIEITEIRPQGTEYVFTGIEVGEMYMVRNDGRIIIAIRNDSAGMIQARFYSTKLHQELEVEDRVIGVPSGKFKAVGPFVKEIFNDPAGDMRFDFDEDTDVEVAAFRLHC